MSEPLTLIKSKTPKQIKELLQEWLEADDLEEVVLLAKRKGKGYRWDHSELVSGFYWMGFLTHVADIMSDYQMEDD